MDAVEYLKAKERMIASMQHCIGCDNCEYDDFCNGVMTNEKQVALIEQWAKEHPIKTYKDVLLEKFPNADWFNCCVEDIFGIEHRYCKTLLHESVDECFNCWNREFKGWS